MGATTLKKPFRPWMRYWDQYDRVNEALDKVIGTEPRLKETPFVSFLSFLLIPGSRVLIGSSR